jgi:hypothetical protein
VPSSTLSLLADHPPRRRSCSDEPRWRAKDGDGVRASMTYPGAGRGDAQRRGRRCSAGHTRAGGTAALRAWCPRITLLAKGGQIRITRASNRGSQGESTSTSNQTITHHTSLTSLLRVAAALMAGGEHLSKLLVTGARTVLRGNETPSHPPKPLACARKSSCVAQTGKRGREKGRRLGAWCGRAVDTRAIWAA